MIIRFIAPAAALALAAGLMLSPLAAAAAGADKPPRVKWSFAGPLGKFDQGQLQRGFKVYREVCANCHSVKRIAFRNLADAGGPAFRPEQVKALAAEYKVKDGPNDQGEMYERPGRPSDLFPLIFANDEAAKAVHNGAAPPDLSLMGKARTYERGFPTFVFDIFTQYQEQGPDYLTALLTGYADAPKGFTVEDGLNYNKYFPGNKIAMANPLIDGQVTYDDGAPGTVAQYARDVTAFMMWTSEPKLTERKQMGFNVVIFLLLLSGLLYYTKKKVWAPVHGGGAAHH